MAIPQLSTHSPEPHVDPLEVRCPVCDQPIPDDKADEVLAHYKAEIEKAKRQADEAAQEQIKALKKKIASLEGSTAGDFEAIAKAKAEGLMAARDEAQQQITELQNQISTLVSDTHVRDAAARKEIETLKTLVRQLENKSPNQIGPQAEFKLFEKLRDRFPDDEISRVPPGTEGADIIHQIIENGKRCGTILYECKNSTVFKEDWVTKLHADQIAKEAHHAILSTYKLPAGSDDQVDIRDGVIIAKPERVPAVAEILRKDAIENHKINISAKGQSHKTEALYAYITSPSFNQRLIVIESLTKKMHELQDTEEKAHLRLWKKREALIKSIEDARNVMHAEIDQIIDETDVGAL